MRAGGGRVGGRGRLEGSPAGAEAARAWVGVFFFSSRRRHTRWTGDWSSDVCSSDLSSQFRLGVGQVIQGWDEGVTGMKVGGRRRLVIPPHQAYGDRGAGGVIAPGETLVFVVDLVGVR